MRALNCSITELLKLNALYQPLFDNKKSINGLFFSLSYPEQNNFVYLCHRGKKKREEKSSPTPENSQTK